MINLIGEVCSNHNRSLKRCFKLIDLCKTMNFQAVKFQLFKIDKLFHSSVLKRSKMHRDRRKWELPVSFLPEIQKYCKKKKIKFGCTPFYLEAVELLKPYVDFYKIASYELLWDELLIKCAKTKKTVIISTGMANYSEVRKAIKILKKNNCKKIIVMHCVSSYPAKLEHCNLNSIKYLSKKLNLEIGWSDHTKNPMLINEIIDNFNVKTIEMHIDLDGKGFEANKGHCWMPNDLSLLKDFLSNKKKIYGNYKKDFSKAETIERLHRSDPSDGLRPLKRVRKIKI
jgi:sialic acid synthase SpsE